VLCILLQSNTDCLNLEWLTFSVNLFVLTFLGIYVQIKDSRDESGRSSGVFSSSGSPQLGFSRSSSRLSMQDDTDDADFPFAVDDVDPDSRPGYVLLLLRLWLIILCNSHRPFLLSWLFNLLSNIGRLVAWKLQHSLVELC
jgi:hypothetical protein